MEGLIFKADFDYSGRDFSFNVTLIDENEEEYNDLQSETEKVFVEKNSDDPVNISAEPPVEPTIDEILPDENQLLRHIDSDNSNTIE